jgi:hypothetical protein
LRWKRVNLHKNSLHVGENKSNIACIKTKSDTMEGNVQRRRKIKLVSWKEIRSKKQGVT